MDHGLYKVLTKICDKCGGRCCYYAKPPLTEERISVLIDNGVDLSDIKFGTYRNLETKSTGFCVCYQDGRCKVQGVKPETCVAGPFTFDIKNNHLEIYIKKDRICDLVTFLKQHPDVFKEQYDIAVHNIMKLVKSLPEDELSAVLMVEETETEKVCDIPLAEVYSNDGRN